MRTLLAFAAAAGLLMAGTASADILAEWTFETSIPATAGPHAAEGGLFAATSFATGFHTDPGVVYSNPVGNGSAESFSSNFWSIGDYYQFTTSTVGFMDITIGFDQTRSSTGPGTFNLAYSTDGVNFTTLVNDYPIQVVSWSSLVHAPESVFGPYGAPAALNDQATVYFRLINQVTPGGTGGTNRVDNIVISGTVIPAPGSFALLGLAAAVGVRRRRK
jgi:uncharacterized protein (TIGR03382 family)